MMRMAGGVVNQQALIGGGGGPTLVGSDDFNRANEGPMAGWTNLSGTDYIQIVSNRARPQRNANDCAMRFNTVASGNDMIVEADFVTNTAHNNNSFWLLARIPGTGTAAPTGYYCAVPRYGGTRQIGRVASGSPTVLTSESNSSTSGTITVRFEVIGTSLELYLDDVLELSTTDSTYSTGTGAGLLGYHSAGLGVMEWDNFNLYDP